MRTCEPLLVDVVETVTDRLVRCFGDEGPGWWVWDVAWATSAPPPPEPFRDLTALTTTGDDPAAVCPVALRGTGAALRVDLRGRARRERASVVLPITEPAERCLVEFASRLQDLVWEGTWAWGLPLPRCPHHESYPLVPKELDRAAVWWCDRCDFRRPLL